MPGDYSRELFDPVNNFVKVKQQQGRLTLDSEWNLQGDIHDRRDRIGTIDMLGHAVVPRETPTAFQIEPSGGTLLIGPGRMYVDGICVEHFGVGELSFNPSLEERSIVDSIDRSMFVDYLKQPYYPSPASLPTQGSFQVYLDVFQREVTAVQDSRLIEPAVGEETTTRVQKVWQVKTLPIQEGEASCELSLEITRPPEGRLSTKAIEFPSDDNPCLLPPHGGYGGLDNRNYRCEVHQAGSAWNGNPQNRDGVATFKWSRDNASIAAAIQGIKGSTIILKRSKRNMAEEIRAGDWIEVLDNVTQLTGGSGLMRRVKNVVVESLEIEFEGDGLPDVQLDTHPRIICWNQRGFVRDSEGNPYANVEEWGGVIPIPPPNKTLVLEAGVVAAFSVEPLTGQPESKAPFRAQNYWSFVARTADASVEELKNAPPRGVHHHFAPLALVTVSSGPNKEPIYTVQQDCRRFWPADSEPDCACTVCVSADSHNSGKLTIQAAINQVAKSGGTVCLGPGTFHLRRAKEDGDRSATIDLSKIRNPVKVEGHGEATCLTSINPGPVIVVRQSRGVTLASFKLVAAVEPQMPPLEDLETGIITVQHSIHTTIEHCTIEGWTSPANAPNFVAMNINRPPMRGGVGIALAGIVICTTIRQNRVSCDTGIACLTKDVVPVTYGLQIEGNLLQCLSHGIHLSESATHFGRTDISANTIHETTLSGITASGLVWPLSPPSTSTTMALGSSQLRLDSNVIDGTGHGLVAGPRSTAITCNLITGRRNRLEKPPIIGNGVVIEGKRYAKLPISRSKGDGCEVRSNRISDINGNGVSIEADLYAADISGNLIQDIGLSGILMDEGVSGKFVSVQGNQVVNVAIAPELNRVKKFVVGIGMTTCEHLTVVDNRIIGIDERGAAQGVDHIGIRIFASMSVRVSGNAVSRIGAGSHIWPVGIYISPTFERLDIQQNQVRKQRPDDNTTDNWHGLVVDTASSEKSKGPNPFPLGLFITLPGMILVPSMLTNIPRGVESMAIVDNLLEVPGGARAANIVGQGICMFANNRCISGNIRTPAVKLEAGGLIITGNYVEGPPGASGMDLKAGSGMTAVTVLGNICTKDITVDDVDLSTTTSPWKSLNVLTV